MLKLGCCFPNP